MSVAGKLDVVSRTSTPSVGHSKANIRLRFYLAAVAADVAAIGIAFGIANLTRFSQADAPAGLSLFLSICPLYFAIAASANIYSSLSIMRWRQAAWRSVTAYVKAVSLLLFIVFFFQTTKDLSRITVAVGSIITLGILPSLRYLFHRAAGAIFNGSPFYVICISDEVPAGAHASARVIDATLAGLKPDVRDPHALDRIGSVLKNADRVIVHCKPEKRLAWASALKGADLYAEIIAPELQGLGSLGAATYNDVPTLAISIPSLDVRSRIWKRSFDLAVATTVLVLMAPLMALTALAIRLDSPGKVLFVQPRLGLGNRLFPMYKFRSMRSDASDLSGNQSTNRRDKRVTRVGRIIRATSIDELPQIFNVLSGDMSIVGPRPHALGSLAGDKLFWEIDQRYWHRHATKPGITGLAQVRGYRGATHAQSDLLARLQSDLEYLNGWSIWRDLSILLATFKVIRHKNAY